MKVGFVCGAFDLLHAGHLMMLAQCKDSCDKLIVGLQVDPSIERKDKNKPIESLIERMIRLDSCRFVDQVIPYEKDEEIETILKMKNVDIRFLGSDYLKKPEEIKFKDLVPIKYTYWFPPTSTTLRERIKKAK